MSDNLSARAVEGPRYSPNELARDAQAILNRLIPLRDTATDKRERKQLSARIKTARILRDWARTRAGHVKPQGAAARGIHTSSSTTAPRLVLLS